VTQLVSVSTNIFIDTKQSQFKKKIMPVLKKKSLEKESTAKTIEN
jgi:hypothetical protein